MSVRYTTDVVADAVHAISTAIAASLSQGKHVLWLTSGGSAIAAQVQIMAYLQEHATSLGNLTVLPVDERYGAYDHVDSNSAQMRAAGFDSGAAAWYDVLDHNLPLAETVEQYTRIAEDAFASAQRIVATLGMGPDAHTAGLLPSSPAVTDTNSTVIGYSWSDYERITLGLHMLLKIDSADVLAYGESKQNALRRLQENSEPFELLPAKILYDLPSVTVYNDFIESEG